MEITAKELDLWEEWNRLSLRSSLLGVTTNFLKDKLFHGGKIKKEIDEIELHMHEI